jgi:hypothetical protein
MLQTLALLHLPLTISSLSLYGQEMESNEILPPFTRRRAVRNCLKILKAIEHHIWNFN